MTNYLCTQCNEEKPRAEFVGKTKALVKMCATCRARRPGGVYQPMPPRHRLRIYAPEPGVIWSSKSGNVKLGPIGSAIISAETCPPSCGFYSNGCYADEGHTQQHWRRAQDPHESLSWDSFLTAVRRQAPGALWRYAVAGDLPGVGEALDHQLLRSLVDANQGRRGFAISHKRLEGPGDRYVVREANQRGFTVNLSADNLAMADARSDEQAGPVVVVLPANAADAGSTIRTPAGRPVAICPAQTHGATCASCQLCQRSRRTGIVGFLAHGKKQQAVSRIASGLGDQ